MKSTFTTSLVLSLVAASANGAIHTVQPGQTIQSVINAASAGDLVEVPQGIYYENLLIDATKTGLILRGVGTQVTIDARPSAPTGTGPGIRVLAADVTIENLAVRHARAATPLSGAGIDIQADGASLLKVVVLRSQNDGVVAVGKDFEATECRFEGNGRGATVTGANAKFVKCAAVRNGDRGLAVTGDNAVVDYCRVESIEDGEGVLLAGLAAQVKHSDVSRIALDGIKVTGDNAIIEKNSVKVTTDKGIRLTGSGGVIRQNFVSDVIRGGDGIRVQNATSGTVIQNIVQNCLENGIEVTSSSGVTITRNTVRSCASEKEASIQITSSTITLESNLVSEGQGDGIRIAGDNNVLTANRIADCLEDGIDINSGAGNTVTGNSIDKCLAEGLENNGTATVCTANISVRNRLDYANNGSFATESGNVYVTGGSAVAPQVDD